MIEPATSTATATPKRAVVDIYPLTPMQQGMAFHALSAPSAALYLEQMVLEIGGVASAEDLAAGLRALVARHPVLRTAVIADTGKPVQVVFDAAELPVPVEDLRGMPVKRLDKYAEDVLAEHRGQPFDLRRPPLWRVRALRVGDDRWYVASTHHHVIFDGWSVPILHADLAELLSARVAGRPAELPPVPAFREFVTYLRDRRGPDPEEHYRRLLGDITRPTPLGADRLGRVSDRSGAIDWARVVVMHDTPSDVDIAALVRARGLLPSTVVHAAWGLLLARYSGAGEAVFGMTVSGRPAELPDAAHRVGMFVNTVPVRVGADPDQSVGDWLRAVQDQLLASRDFEQTPISVAHRCSGVPLSEPLVETVLAFQNYWRPELDRPEADGVTLRLRRRVERTSMPIALAVTVSGRGVWVRLDYDRARFDRPVADRMARHYARLVAALATADENTRLGDIPLLDAAESKPPQPRADRPGFAALLADCAPAAATELRRLAGAGWPGMPDTVVPEPGGDPVGAAVRVLSGAVDVGPDDRVLAALAPTDPVLLPLALAVRRAGARLELRDPLAPGECGAATLVAGPPAAVAALAPAGVRVLLTGPDAVPPTLFERLRDNGCRTWRVEGSAATGMHGCAEADRVGMPMPGGHLLDGDGQPVPEGAAGELVIREPGGDLRTGIRARRLAGGLIETLGHGDEWRWAERQLAADPEVAEAAVVAGPEGPVAWIVPADGWVAVSRAALLDRARRVLPAGLLPVAVETVPWLPRTASGAVDRAALAADEPPAAATARATPVADRLAHLPADRRTALLERLRAADATAERADDLEYWRRTLRAAPADAVPADRVPPDAEGIGTVPAGGVPPAAGTADCVAAVAGALAVAGGTDELVLAVSVRRERPGDADVLPLRVPVDPAAGFGALTAAVATTLAEALRHRRPTWPELAALLPTPPLVTIVLPEASRPSGTGIAVTVATSADGHALTAEYDRARVLPETADGLLRRAAALLRAGLAEPDRAWSAADLVTAEDRTRLLEWADGGTSDDPAQTITDLVLARAAATPDAIAVHATDGELGYAELVARARALAGALADAGVGPGDRVAVCLPRTAALVWAPLGVLLTGAAYVPVDPGYPDSRVEFLCADAGVTAAVTIGAHRHRFGGTVIAVDAGPLPPSGHHVPVAPSAAAYVIYTSGSTGLPKGVLVEHRAVADFCRHIATAYRIDAATRLLGFAALTFDVSVFELWTALTTGATLVLAGDEERLSADRLQRLMIEQRVTVAELPPSLMPLLSPESLPDLRLVSVGGEAPAGALVDRWASADREFWNGYGPTETTVAVTLARCLPPSGGRVPPIGRPMTNHRAYVLDDRQRLVPPGVPGELCIAGAGLARGYLGRPDQTADRFRADPYGGPGDRLYRTGDLVRFLPDGQLEFLGRIDRQVKLRGFRVELGEVESVLAADPRVRQVAVEPWDDESGTRHLAAYVVPAPGDAPGLAEIREIAAAALPEYMVPTRLAVLDRLPLTPTGKLDRAALPAPDSPDGAGPELGSDDELTETERVLAAEVFAPLLKAARVGRDDDFFGLGGNSLQATQVASRVRDRFGVEISLVDLFAQPTVANLARLVEAARRQASDERDRLYVAGADWRMRDGEELPASYPQAALWQAERREGGNPGFHAPFTLRMRGALDLAALRAAFEAVATRHAPLRTTFREHDGEVLQRVHAEPRIGFEVADVPEADADARRLLLGRLVRQETERPFDLGGGPLLRVRVHRLGPADHAIQWTTHHLVTDGWSVALQLRELGDAYHACAAGRPPEFEPLSADYADFVGWHREYVAGAGYRADLDWWRATLRDVTPLGLPADQDRAGHDRAGHVFRPGYHNVRLPADTAEGVLALARSTNTTLFMVTAAAWALTLSAAAGNDDVTVLVPNALRVRSAWEPLVGWFANRVALRLRVDDRLPLVDYLDRVRAESIAAFAHQYPPFELLRDELALPDGALAACFSVQNAPSRGIGFRGFDLADVPSDTGVDFTPIGAVYAPLGRKYEASLMLRERAPGLIAGGLEYDAGLVTAERAESWREGFLRALDAFHRQPSTTVGALRRLVTG